VWLISLGLCFGYGREITGSLLGPIAPHAMVNATVSLLDAFPFSV